MAYFFRRWKFSPKFVGLSSDQRRKKYGYGLQLTKIQEKYAGNRDKGGALGLWNSLPELCREHAVFYSDFWSAYKEIFPLGRHFSVGKESGKTSHSERFNLTLQQRVSRLGKKTLSFSKKSYRSNLEFHSSL